MNLTNSDVYERKVDEWVWSTNIRGRKGKDGTDGKNGKNGIDGKVISMGGFGSAVQGNSNTTPKVNVLSCIDKDTVYPFALPLGCTRFVLKARLPAKLKLRYEEDGDYFTIGLGGFFADGNFYDEQIIYIQSDKDNTEVEIITYK